MQGIGQGSAAKAVENPVPHGEMATFRGSQSLDEVLVGVGLVELHHLDRGVILHPELQPGQALGDEGLPNTRRALEDDVLLAAELFEDVFQRFAGNEQLLKSDVNRVRGGQRRRRCI